MIGIIGPPYVGKTTYLKELKRALANQGWIFTEALEQSKKLKPPGTLTPGAQWESLSPGNADRPDHLFPPKTHLDLDDPESSIEKSTYRITRDGEVHEFVFLDPPGEVFMPGSSDGASLARAREIVFGEMNDWEGLIVLLDLVRPADDLRHFWLNSVNIFRTQIHEDKAPKQLTLPTAVVFTKADQIPHFGRYRPPDAEAWVRRHPEFQFLYQDICRNCKPVRFYFASATGWTDGMQNLRTHVVPPDINFLKSANDKERSILPDPAIGFAAAGSHPLSPPPKNVDSSLLMHLLNDPLRLAPSRPGDEDWVRLGKPYGVLECPRRQDRSGHLQAIQPWNVVDPLLWTARKAKEPKQQP